MSLGFWAGVIVAGFRFGASGRKVWNQCSGVLGAAGSFVQGVTGPYKALAALRVMCRGS